MIVTPTLLIVRGIVGILVGVLSFAWPGLTIAVLVGVFGAYALIDGIANLIVGLTNTPRHGRSWAHALQGLVGIAAGVLTFLWPGITAIALIAFIAAWAILTGVLEIVAAVHLRREIRGEWLLALSGILSVILGILFLAFPRAGEVGIAWTLGAYAAASGIALVALGIKLRSRPLVAS